MLDKPSGKKIRERKRREQADIYFPIPLESLDLTQPIKSLEQPPSSGKHYLDIKKRVMKSRLGKSLSNLSRFEPKPPSFHKKQKPGKGEVSSSKANGPFIEKEYHSAVEFPLQHSSDSIPQNGQS
uniref:Uncharacterized protein n=1 Tax=Rhabditophanes sp. KR3021 TaxID=114890 RepID=A0AC35TW11_9BILA